VSIPDQHLHDPFARSVLRAELREQLDSEAAAAARERRVFLFAQCCDALLAGAPVPIEARLFVGGAGRAWLEQGGDLVGDFLGLRAPRGSHATPSTLWQRIRVIDDDDTARSVE
jgi:hypothetical protein